MTEPLPVKVLGGTIEDAERAGFLKMPQYSRDPRPKNGDAYDLFSSDLLAVKTGELTHPFESREKELLKVGERLGLRGEEVDKLIGEVIAKERLAAAEAVKDAYNGMVLTVIEGDFPRDVIAKHNLHFEAFKAKDLELARNKPPVQIDEPIAAESNEAGNATILASTAIALLFGIFLVRRKVSPSRNPKHHQ